MVVLKKTLKTHFGYLFFGIIALLPVAIAFVVLNYLFEGIDSAGRGFLHLIVPSRTVYTGLGFVLVVFVCYLLGIMLKRTSVGGFLSRIPLVGMFFGKRDGGTMTLGRLLNLKPCLFLYSPSCPSYGWILSEEPVAAFGGNRIYDIVNVYYPNVPTIVTGSIFPVRKESVMLLGNTSGEVLDLLLYSLRTPKSIKLEPWPGESPEVFARRAASFGIQPDATPNGIKV